MAALESTSEIFELRFTGTSIRADVVSAGELAQLLQAFEDSLISIVLRDYDELEAKNLVVSLVEVESRSLRLKFKPRLREILFSAFLIVSNSIQANAYGNLPVKAVEALQTINRFCKTKKCLAEWRDNPFSDLPLATLTPESEIIIPETSYLFGETTVYGKVLRVGGVDPKVSLKLGDTQPILYCSISQELAKEIAQDLYLDIGFKGTAKWYLADYTIVDFKISEIVRLNKTSFVDTMKDLKNLIGVHWNDVKDVIDEVSKIRGAIS